LTWSLADGEPFGTNQLVVLRRGFLSDELWEVRMAVRRKSILAGVLVAVLALAGPYSALGQVTSGSLSGTVKDPQGGVIPGATVVLISDTRLTRSSPVVTNETGDFVFPNIAPDTYTIQVEMPSFKILQRAGISVSAGAPTAIGSLVLEPGGIAELVSVTAEAPELQTTSGVRSFTVTQSQVENLPVASRSFQAFTALTPGVDGVTRLGGGGFNNVMLDGVGIMDNAVAVPVIQVNTETVQEVTILTSGYSAEYGRASGLQITAVTKSGTNRFRGSVYDVERNSDWNNNSKTNILNEDPKTVVRQRDLGFTIGGPVGKPGGDNKLFFFYAQEWNPRTAGADVRRFRLPTAAERAGDFSKTLDQNGAPYPYIRDPRTGSAACSQASQLGCYADGGVVGKIPQNQLYAPGLAILNWWPLPTISNAAGLAYNYEIVRPLEKALGYQPVIKVDYVPFGSLRLTGKFAAYGQRPQTFLGILPGFTDTRPSKMITPTYTVSAGYTIRPSMFTELTVGHTSFQQEGCSFGAALGSPGPGFCTSAIAQSPSSNYQVAGFGALPLLYPDAQVIDRSYHYIKVLDAMKPPYWDGTRLWRAPTFSWGNRVPNAPPNTPFPTYFQAGNTWDVSTSITIVSGPHTIKAGYYYQYNRLFRNSNVENANGSLSFAHDTVGLNPFDTSFGFANAATGAFSLFSQRSKFTEGKFVYRQHEFFVQDSWRLTSRLTMDYGMRFVHAGPYFDERLLASQFFPDRWSAADAPLLYAPGCVTVSPCSGTNRQATDPRTGQFLGTNSAVAIGVLVPNTGNLENGTVPYGQGIVRSGYTFPALGFAPRFGLAYDVRGDQTFVFRGSAGLFFDRTTAQSTGAHNLLGGPPFTETSTVRFGQLQTLGSVGLTTNAPPNLNSQEYRSPLPASVQFSGGTQLALPWSTVLDVAYVGQHSYNTIQAINLNAIDIGAAFLPSNRDVTVAQSATPGASSLVATNPNSVRSFQGYGSITHRRFEGWRTYHSIQFSINRRFRNGFSVGFNDTIGLYDREGRVPRLEHPSAGVYVVRADDAEYQRLLGNNDPRAHTMKANFVWDLPDMQISGGAGRVAGAVLNDWQLAGVWTGLTSSPYTIGFNYANGGTSVNLTGSPDYPARIQILDGQDPGKGCSEDPYRQFNTSAFAGPVAGSNGLESGTGYLRDCFSSAFDLSIQRTIRLGGSRSIELRVDMFNAPNSARITSRQTTMQLTNPANPTGVTNLPFDSTGALIPTRSQPKNAGFGVANGYQSPRSVQLQVRFVF
jgi:hypothetical protein